MEALEGGDVMFGMLACVVAWLLFDWRVAVVVACLAAAMREESRAAVGTGDRMREAEHEVAVLRARVAGLRVLEGGRQERAS